MFRVRTMFAMFAACLGWVLFLQTPSALREDASWASRAGASASTCGYSCQEETATFVEAATDHVSAAALTEVGAPQWQVVSERFWKRLTLIATASHSGPFRPSIRERLPDFNWVSSYLPDLEFCTVLSRFRL